MKTLRKIRKNDKALSPVVASIILIAVTVAVSIAVAAWMGALTVGFMETKTVTITDMNFYGTQDIAIAVKNTGTSPVTISIAKVNGVNSLMNSTSVTIVNGESANIGLTSTWTAGDSYKIDLLDSNGQLVGSYQKAAA